MTPIIILNGLWSPDIETPHDRVNRQRHAYLRRYISTDLKIYSYLFEEMDEILTEYVEINA